MFLKLWKNPISARSFVRGRSKSPKYVFEIAGNTISVISYVKGYKKKNP